MDSAPVITVSAIRCDPDLGFRLRVLLYDLYTCTHALSSLQRISSATDPLYFGLPYFTPEEAKYIRKAIADTDDDSWYGGYQPPTVQAKIHMELYVINQMHRRYPDIFPFAPSSMAVLYQKIFGVSNEDLFNEDFWDRLDRQGLQLPDSSHDLYLFIESQRLQPPEDIPEDTVIEGKGKEVMRY